MSTASVPTLPEDWSRRLADLRARARAHGADILERAEDMLVLDWTRDEATKANRPQRDAMQAAHKTEGCRHPSGRPDPDGRGEGGSVCLDRLMLCRNPMQRRGA
jgi:hypothetical protein